MTTDRVPDDDRLGLELAQALATTPSPDAARRLQARVTASWEARQTTVTRQQGMRSTLMGLIATTGVVAIMGLAALIMLWQSGTIGPGVGAVPSDGVHHPLQASWARGYTDFADLAADADLIIEGVIREPAPSPGWVPARLRMDATRVLRGPMTTIIEVVPSGSIIGDPPMMDGDHLLLFLRRIDDGPRDPARAPATVVLGGPQGRFAVAPDGTLTPVGEPHISPPTGTTVEDVVMLLATSDAEALMTCRRASGSIPLGVVRSGTPEVVDAGVVSGGRLSSFLDRAGVATVAPSPLGMADQGVACIIDGDFEMATPGSSGQQEEAERVLVVVTQDRIDLLAWTHTRAALPVLDP